jgi:hypothetical protein
LDISKVPGVRPGPETEQEEAVIVCLFCGHFREQHFRTDEHGHEDQQPCVEAYGSGRWLCRCFNWEASGVSVRVA